MSPEGGHARLVVAGKRGLMPLPELGERTTVPGLPEVKLAVDVIKDNFLGGRVRPLLDDGTPAVSSDGSKESVRIQEFPHYPRGLERFLDDSDYHKRVLFLRGCRWYITD
ncbi:hypothetical protein HPB52_002210 [Rhipicephalus sanguineus]|uniref:Uncharacterized protein n=1 Tax=Rhipicephalus sanguineus TaxID=34632 RepID=A0A9D4Q8N3_RHISA|nr:hypothetical protein HPB52_002210 [Rhipicephalus sanguineus]